VVGDLHLLQYGGAIVRDRDVSVGRYEDLVEAAGAERGLDDVCYRAGREDVGLDRFRAILSLLLPLALEVSDGV
jgi:hypothetical protein